MSIERITSLLNGFIKGQVLLNLIATHMFTNNYISIILIRPKNRESFLILARVVAGLVARAVDPEGASLGSYFFLF